MEKDITKQINIEKGNGKPYIDMLEEEYNNMTIEEKNEVDKLGEELCKKFGITDNE